DCYCGVLADREALIEGNGSGSGSGFPRAFRAKIYQGQGRCDCITDQGLNDDDPDSWIILLYNFVSDRWEGVVNFQTCCGCGYLTFSIPDPEDGSASGQLIVNESCNTGTNYTYDLIFDCCRNGIIQFEAAKKDNCNSPVSTDPGCPNSFKVT